MQSPWHRGWVALVVTATLVELTHLRQPDRTLSAAARIAFRTHTPAGRRAFVLAWAALTVWFVPHILESRDS